MNGEMCKKTINELTGQKQTHKYRGDKLYFSVFPQEVFISSVRDKDHYEGALIDMGTRMISLALRLGGEDDVLDQLKKSSRSKKDIPGILYRVLGGRKQNNRNDSV